MEKLLPFMLLQACSQAVTGDRRWDFSKRYAKGRIDIVLIFGP